MSITSNMKQLILVLMILCGCSVAQAQITIKEVVSSASDPSTCVVGKLYINTTAPGKVWARVGGVCTRVDGTAAGGSVTSVSVVTANGLSGTVADPTTTPAITLNIAALDATKIADGTVTSAEFQFINSLTSNAQTQIDAKAPTTSPTFTGTVTIPTPFTLGAVSVLATGTELNFVDGVTSAIQTQLDGKQASLGFTAENVANKDATGGYAGLTGFKINFKNTANTFTSLLENANTAARTYTFQDRNGTIADNTDLALKAPLASPTFTGTVTIPTPFTLGAVSVLPTGTELNFIDGVTSAIQTQLDGKQATITFGTGVQTALGVNIGSAGAPVLFNGAGGTPTSLVGTNISGTAAGLTAGNVTTNANLTGPITSTGNATAVAAQTGTGSTFVMQANPTLTTPIFTSYTVATLPAAGTAGRLAVVTDASTAGSCTVGGGTALAYCRDSGTAWVPLGDGGGGGIGGSTGATDNALLAADGTGGSTLQNRGVTLSDTQQMAFTAASNTAVLTHNNNGRMALRQTDSSAGVPSWSTNALNFGFNAWEDATAWQQGNAVNAGAVFRVLNQDTGVAFQWIAGTGSGGGDPFNGTNIKMDLSSAGVLRFGASSDTGIARNAAGVVEVNSGTAGTLRDLKARDVIARVAPRTASITSNATWSPNADTDDMFIVTAQAVAVTTIANPSGTPVEGQKLMMRVKDDSTARAISGWGTQYRFSTDLAAPTTTILGKTLYIGFIFNSTDTKWDMIALINNF